MMQPVEVLKHWLNPSVLNYEMANKARLDNR